MANEEEKKKKVKMPTAQKRGIQDEKKYARNHAFIAKLRTVKANFNEPF